MHIVVVAASTSIRPRTVAVLSRRLETKAKARGVPSTPCATPASAVTSLSDPVLPTTSTTASGLAMLAALPGRQVTALYPSAAELVARPGAPRTPSHLRRELVAVRRRGHAVEVGTVTAGLASVALPVLDRTDRPTAAVALTYPEGSVSDLESLLVPLRRAADALQARLNSRDGEPGRPA